MKIKPLIYWPGLRPVSLITKKVVEKYEDDLVFVSSPSFDKTFKMPDIKEFEKQLGHKVIWLNHPDEIWDRKEEFSDINLIIHTGWNSKGWLKFDKYMKKSGAKIVLTLDNSYKGTFRQYLGAIYFRLFLKPIFDATFITGKSSYKLMKFFGMPENRIYRGLLGSNKNLYFYDKNIIKKQEFLFVGQLIKRKNFDILVKGYLKYKQNGGKYSLRVIGDGKFRNLITNDIIYEGFLKPHEVAKRMKETICLILPSLEDHWPTVLHEAMCCGCLIMPSIHCGNYVDLLEDGVNGYLLKYLSVDELVEKMFAIEKMNEKQIKKGIEKSLELSKNFGDDVYFESFEKIVGDLFD